MHKLKKFINLTYSEQENHNYMYTSSENLIIKNLSILEGKDSSGMVTNLIKKNYTETIKNTTKYTVIASVISDVIQPLETVFDKNQEYQKPINEIFTAVCDMAYIRSIQLKHLIEDKIEDGQ